MTKILDPKVLINEKIKTNWLINADLMFKYMSNEIPNTSRAQRIEHINRIRNTLIELLHLLPVPQE